MGCAVVELAEGFGEGDAILETAVVASMMSLSASQLSTLEKSKLDEYLLGGKAGGIIHAEGNEWRPLAVEEVGAKKA